MKNIKSTITFKINNTDSDFYYEIKDKYGIEDEITLSDVFFIAANEMLYKDMCEDTISMFLDKNDSVWIGHLNITALQSVQYLFSLLNIDNSDAISILNNYFSDYYLPSLTDPLQHEGIDYLDMLNLLLVSDYNLNKYGFRITVNKRMKKWFLDLYKPHLTAVNDFLLDTVKKKIVEQHKSSYMHLMFLYESEK